LPATTLYAGCVETLPLKPTAVVCVLGVS